MKYIDLINESPTLNKLDSEKKEKLSSYMDGILEWNEKVNLTAITNPEEFIKKHYEDSLSIMDFPEYKDAQKVLDVGTGGGFPGIPLAIVSPEKEFYLLDSTAKRLKIVDALADELDIRNIKTLHGRTEDLGREKEFRETFPLCVSRAVADMAVLSEYTLPFLSKGGFFLAYKSLEIEEELLNAKKAIEILGGTIIRKEETGENKQIIVIEKTGQTPKAYPRKAGTPKAKPL